jgi:RNA polymerase sigma-70 factor (ECF subfamily)
VFFKEYFPRLFRFALGRVDNDPALAEEVVQRTMCIVVRKMGTYRGEALLFTWLCQICRNEMSAVYRQRGDELREYLPIEDHPAVQAALESMGGDDFSPETAQTQKEIGEFVRSTLQHLPGRYAQALEMKYVNGNSVNEIALELGLSEKAAESLLTRARKAFKEGFNTLWDFEPGLEL